MRCIVVKGKWSSGKTAVYGNRGPVEVDNFTIDHHGYGVIVSQGNSNLNLVSVVICST